MFVCAKVAEIATLESTVASLDTQIRVLEGRRQDMEDIRDVEERVLQEAVREEQGKLVVC